MLKCKWHKCGKEFEPKKPNQVFCCDQHKIAHNNWLKMTGIHFIPQIYSYIESIAKSQIPPVSVDEMANKMFLTFTGHEEAELKKSERPGEYLKTIEGLSQ